MARGPAFYASALNFYSDTIGGTQIHAVVFAVLPPMAPLGAIGGLFSSNRLGLRILHFYVSPTNCNL